MSNPQSDLLSFDGRSNQVGDVSPPDQWELTLRIISLADRAGHPSTPSVVGQDGEENPATLAENCFRELLGRAAYGNMNNAVRPVLV